jgi:uncharacterized protein DUF4129
VSTPLPRPPSRHSPPAVAWILVLAVLVGVAAALLARPVGGVGSAPSSIGVLTWSQLTQILSIGLLLSLGLWLFFALRDSGQRVPFPPWLTATILMTLLLGVVFVEVAGLVHFSPIPGSGNSTGKNGSGPPSPNGTNPPPTGAFGFHGVSLPAWAGFAAILVIAIVAGVLLVPLLISRAEERRRAANDAPASAREVQRALQETLDKLSGAAGEDARAAILALYLRLLLLVEPRLGPVEALTPREIEESAIATLGLRKSVAADLTETFEEARYSSHAMSGESVARARSALAGAIADLASNPGATR